MPAAVKFIARQLTLNPQWFEAVMKHPFDFARYFGDRQRSSGVCGFGCVSSLGIHEMGEVLKHGGASQRRPATVNNMQANAVRDSRTAASAVSSYDDSCEVFFCVCAWPFYGAYAFYHKAKVSPFLPARMRRCGLVVIILSE